VTRIKTMQTHMIKAITTPQEIAIKVRFINSEWDILTSKA